MSRTLETLEARRMYSADRFDLPFGGTVEGEISSVGEVDVAVFEGTRGQRVTIGMFDRELERFFNARVELVGPESNNPILDFGPTEHRQIDLPADGRYELRISDNNRLERGKYLIGLESITPASPDAKPLAFGRVVEGTIAGQLQVDQYTFQADEGSILRVAILGREIDRFYNVNWSIFNVDTGEAVANGAGTNQFTVPETGRYVLQVQDNNNFERGTYAFSVDLLNAPNTDTAVVRNDGTLSGTIARGVQGDQYAVTVDAGQTLNFTLRSTETDRFFFAEVNIFAEQNVDLGRFITRFTQTPSFSHTFEKAGTYYISVNDNNFFERGVYELTVRGLPYRPFTVEGGVLFIDGTDGRDTITAKLEGSRLAATVNGATQRFSTTAVRRVEVYAGAGNDAVTLGEGAPNTYVLGGGGNDTIVGGPGRDILSGGAGRDLIDGGAGDDRISGGAAFDTLNGGDGADRIYGGDGNDLLRGGNGADRLWGDAGNDQLFGDSSNDRLDGGAGSDTLVGGKGRDRLAGGSGTDTASRIESVDSLESDVEVLA